MYGRRQIRGARSSAILSWPARARLDRWLADAGDCQHFASAAALLLRLAGVPARVVVGFATGVPEPGGRFTVRDVDAHAWIEVYFQGIGWVAFNPTPPAAPANIPASSTPSPQPPQAAATTPTAAPGGLGWLSIGAILAALATAGILVARRRTRRGPVPLGPLLEALVRRSGGHVQPASTLADLGVQLAPRPPRWPPRPSAPDSPPAPQRQPPTRTSSSPGPSPTTLGPDARCWCSSPWRQPVSLANNSRRTNSLVNAGRFNGC